MDPGGLLSAATRAELCARAERAVEALGCRGEVRVKVIGDEEMAAAHVRYSGVEGTTDVLTFDLADGGAAKGEPLDVDILVCADEARRRGAEFGHPMERELLLYVVHGVLHCLGHDDHDEAGYAKMHALEDEVLAAIGVGAVFAPEGGAGTEGCSACEDRRPKGPDGSSSDTNQWLKPLATIVRPSGAKTPETASESGSGKERA